MGCFNAGGDIRIVTDILHDVFTDRPLYLFIDDVGHKGVCIVRQC